MDADIVVPMAFFVTVISIGLPMARAWARRLDRGGGRVTLPPGTAERFERMEQALDAIALEVERISEGQRFTTRLLSERATLGGGDPVALGAPPRDPLG